MNKIEEISEKLLNDLALVAPEDTGMRRSKIYVAMVSVVSLCANECNDDTIEYADGSEDTAHEGKQRILRLAEGATW